MLVRTRTNFVRKLWCRFHCYREYIVYFRAFLSTALILFLFSEEVLRCAQGFIHHKTLHLCVVLCAHGFIRITNCAQIKGGRTLLCHDTPLSFEPSMPFLATAILGPIRRRLRRDGRGAWVLRLLDIGMPVAEAAAANAGVPAPNTGGLVAQMMVSVLPLIETSTDLLNLTIIIAGSLRTRSN